MKVVMIALVVVVVVVAKMMVLSRGLRMVFVVY